MSMGQCTMGSREEHRDETSAKCCCGLWAVSTQQQRRVGDSQTWRHHSCVADGWVRENGSAVDLGRISRAVNIGLQQVSQCCGVVARWARLRAGGSNEQEPQPGALQSRRYLAMSTKQLPGSPIVSYQSRGGDLVELRIRSPYGL